MALSKPQELTKPSSSGDYSADDCKEAIKDFKLSIEKLLKEVDKAHKAGLTIDTTGIISPESISELLSLINKDPVEAARRVNRLV
jgi:hypothetical protein